MSTLGKILMVLNGLAAVAFLCLAAIDWGTRQLWAYQVFRGEVALRGLPVDQEEVWKLPSTVSMREFGDETLRDIFGGKDPVPTQIAEVERKIKELDQEIAGLDTDAKKRARLKSILMPLEQTGDERDRIGAMKSVEKLQEELKKRFDAVLSPYQNEDEGQRRDPDEWRRAIAHLLYNLSPDADGHQRVMVVIGLQAYTREADRQARDLEQMVQRVRDMTADERVAFERDYQQRIHRRLVELAQQTLVLEDALKQKQALKESTKNGLAETKKKIDELRERVAKAREATVAALQKQTEQEKELFEAQRELIIDFDKNLQLEKQLRRMELGR